jgi:hypothetical protein
VQSSPEVVRLAGEQAAAALPAEVQGQASLL